MNSKPSTLRLLFDKYREVIMYIFFGGITTIVSWLVYSICEKGLGFGLFASGIVSWIIAVSVAFVTNKLWVFDSKSWQAKLVFTEAVAFFGGRLATGALEVVAVPALVKLGLDSTLFGVEGLPAKIIVSVVIIILNYILSKFFAFNFGKKKADK
ncbi:MAG: GtrA family protein [Oscillospiraceae bacterium]